MSNVTFTVEELGLRDITLQTMPRLQRMRDRHFAGKPAICTELPRNITTFWKEKLDKPPDKDDSPELKAGKLYQYVMEKKEPIIAQDNLLAGTTTAKPLGVVLYPDLYPLCIWPELETIATRKKNPFDITPEQIKELNSVIFPYWLKNDTIMEATRKALKRIRQRVRHPPGKAGLLSGQQTRVHLPHHPPLRHGGGAGAGGYHPKSPGRGE